MPTKIPSDSQSRAGVQLSQALLARRRFTDAELAAAEGEALELSADLGPLDRAVVGTALLERAALAAQLLELRTAAAAVVGANARAVDTAPGHEAEAWSRIRGFTAAVERLGAVVLRQRPAQRAAAEGFAAAILEPGETAHAIRGDAVCGVELSLAADGYLEATRPGVVYLRTRVGVAGEVLQGGQIVRRTRDGLVYVLRQVTAPHVTPEREATLRRELAEMLASRWSRGPL